MASWHIGPPVRALAAIVALGALSCEHATRKLIERAQADTVDREAAFLKAHMKDGRVYVLKSWSQEVVQGALRGEGTLYDTDRASIGQGAFQIPLSDVALFETNSLHQSPSVLVLAVVTGVSLAATAFCIANPKACFGSCPTFYIGEGSRTSLVAEGFSDSIAPALEATDVDALYHARAAGRALDVRMTNEALETHVVKHVSVLAALRPNGGRVFKTPDGAFLEAQALFAPEQCAAPEGDCARTLNAYDGLERTSTTDPHDLATRETIDVVFPDPGDSKADFGLVIAARQSLLSTYLLYQGLAYLGNNATALLARLEKRDETQGSRPQGMMALLGGIEVQTRDEGGAWISAGEAYETGPLAVDVHLIRIGPLRAGRPAAVRLRLTRGHWRLDWVALARLGARIEPTRLEPIQIVGKRTEWPIVALPGDETTLRYRLPADPERYELFLESRGYYLEWMRQQWIEEEDPIGAAKMFFTPETALRDLAPAYKAQEASMEKLFWGSRFARP